MNTFPNLSRTPSINWTEQYPAEAVSVASKASGLPVVNKLFTTIPPTFSVTYKLASQGDKNNVVDFYLDNCGVPFNWVNKQDGLTYEVVFGSPPQFSLSGIKTRWDIQITLIKY